ncbi:hypothetical protein TCAL_11716 [Tigriopus californicus]|uniref:Homeobox domain-containing protein n=1 Tax=Tigriopus californicus TaxID=6832 RepID=A0A553ND56_TIGCA|nr:LIM/homeobox protein Lhx2-like [Tigriopus californicus]TRY63386.1 hypothetical protein TCAL_11716 [Tigriopus californicus]|eukprot:TCALIF_11716-PA protein Name:"Similar to ap Protein apterous (Drosophila melanogaster)" AED:0.04 eAED:0.04 QI:265/1/1/1/1/1/4/59/485
MGILTTAPTDNSLEFFNHIPKCDPIHGQSTSANLRVLVSPTKTAEQETDFFNQADSHHSVGMAFCPSPDGCTPPLTMSTHHTSVLPPHHASPPPGMTSLQPNHKISPVHPYPPTPRWPPPNLNSGDEPLGAQTQHLAIPPASNWSYQKKNLPSEDADGTPLCAGCRLRIMDKFFLSAVEGKWHSSCLKCAECDVELETQSSCFEREGLIFCKRDYLRIYGNRQCSRCLQEIQSSDLVMKARNCLFHVDCFRCTTCDVLLRKGDLFGMFEDVLYCRMHFEVLESPPHSSSDPTHPFPFPPQGYPHHFGPNGEPWFPPGEYPMGLPSGDFPFDNNKDPILKKRRGRKKRKVDGNFSAMNAFMDGGYAGLDGSGAQSKAKRARTSFKHHQLRIMKAHFQVNQNPDSRELKMLSQKTALDKKVLQVWFQNARAKWRRVNAQGGNRGGTSGAAGGAGVSSGDLGEAGSTGSSMVDHLSEENGDSDSMPAC